MYVCIRHQGAMVAAAAAAAWLPRHLCFDEQIWKRLTPQRWLVDAEAIQHSRWLPYSVASRRQPTPDATSGRSRLQPRPSSLSLKHKSRAAIRGHESVGDCKDGVTSLARLQTWNQMTSTSRARNWLNICHQYRPHAALLMLLVVRHKTYAAAIFNWNKLNV